MVEKLKLVSESNQTVQSDEDEGHDLRGVLSDQDLESLRKRNEERAAAARAKLGRNWTCHSANKAVKKGESSVLEQHRKTNG